jgi:hypothetical protein
MESLMPLTYKPLWSKRLGVVMLTVNALGAVVYVFLASHGWSIPQERGLHATTGEPFVWALYVWPILFVFLLVNLAWGVIILLGRHWSGGRLWLLTAVLWSIAVAIDFAHH